MWDVVPWSLMNLYLYDKTMDRLWLLVYNLYSPKTDIRFKLMEMCGSQEAFYKFPCKNFGPLL